MTDPRTLPDNTASARRAAAARLPDRIAFLGFGLLGGSIAMALREAGIAARLTAWTPQGTGPAEGLRRGLLDAVADSPTEAIEGAHLVVLAGPPLAIVERIESEGWELRDAVATGATLTDVGSTKARIVAAADAAGLPFVGGHPMAGREVTGVGGATGDLFVDRPWVIVPAEHARDADVERVEGLAAATGAHPIRVGAAEHDAAVAAISHLPLVVSAALVRSVTSAPGADASWPLAQRLAATGWRDMTRLARGDPEMGAGIVATNPQAVRERLVAFVAELQAWIDRLEPEETDATAVRDELERARRALDAAERT
jgi:prephenate dehydrogenase